MSVFKYDNKPVRETDTDGNLLAGIAESFPSGYGLQEYGREEECIKIGGSPDRIERVKKYERLFDEVTACPDAEKIRLLENYYTSGEWLEDYTADENGEFPPDLKRGVLSQDALYDLLENAKEQGGRIPESSFQ